MHEGAGRLYLSDAPCPVHFGACGKTFVALAQTASTPLAHFAQEVRHAGFQGVSGADEEPGDDQAGPDTEDDADADGDLGVDGERDKDAGEGGGQDGPAEEEG